jgi:hypothetical protein
MLPMLIKRDISSLTKIQRNLQEKTPEVITVQGSDRVKRRGSFAYQFCLPVLQCKDIR